MHNINSKFTCNLLPWRNKLYKHKFTLLITQIILWLTILASSLYILDYYVNLQTNSLQQLQQNFSELEQQQQTLISQIYSLQQQLRDTHSQTNTPTLNPWFKLFFSLLASLKIANGELNTAEIKLISKPQIDAHISAWQTQILFKGVVANQNELDKLTKNLGNKCHQLQLKNYTLKPIFTSQPDNQLAFSLTILIDHMLNQFLDN